MSIDVRGRRYCYHVRGSDCPLLADGKSWRDMFSEKEIGGYDAISGYGGDVTGGWILSLIVFEMG